MEYNWQDKFMIFKFKGKIHKKIILYYSNFKNHIKIKHSEMTIEKIQVILEDPDYVYKPSRNSEIYYYEKNFEQDIYRAVIKKHKKHVKEVITAYKVYIKEGYTLKHVYCVYDKDTFIKYKHIQKELENDLDYFYEVFNIAE